MHPLRWKLKRSQARAERSPQGKPAEDLREVRPHQIYCGSTGAGESAAILLAEGPPRKTGKAVPLYRSGAERSLLAFNAASLRRVGDRPLCGASEWWYLSHRICQQGEF